MPEPKTRPLSVFLLKQDVDAAASAFVNVAMLARYAVLADASQIGELFVDAGTPHPPGWEQLFRGRVRPDITGVVSASSAAVLVMNAAGRMFAVTFGHGRHLLRPGTWEENFGLRVTLNSLDPNKVRSLDRKTFEAVSRHTRDQASREIPIREFGLDVEQDLLRAAVGTPRDERLGKRLAGSDSLQATAKVDLDGLAALLALYAERWRTRDYQTHFPWVDNIAEVNDKTLAACLDNLLVERIRRRETDRVWLAIPEIIDWQDLSGFAMTARRGQDLTPDVQLPLFLSHMEGKDITISALRGRKVHCFDASGDTVTRSWSVYQCAYGEIDHAGHLYILNGGKWYRADPSFVASLNADILRIPVSRVAFPAYTHANEAEYNAAFAAANPRDFALMDRTPLRYGGGQSAIEICDLLGRDRAFVHVKRYGGSSVLSHLFAQGSVAGELFVTDETFRVAINARFPRGFKLARARQRPAPSEWRVVYAIVTRSDEERPILPLFSRVNLRSAARRITGLGLGIEIAWIRVQRP